MKLSAPPPPPPPPNDDTPGAGAPGAPDEQPKPDAALPAPAADAPAAPGALPAPTPTAETKPSTWPAWYAGLDSVLVGTAVVFALLMASFVARNSDVWLHLAAGKRLIAPPEGVGRYVPGGSDPFSYAAEGRTWVNHSWLTDAGAYLLYSLSPQVLGAAKALLVAGAFGLLLAIRRPGFAAWPWAVLAVVGVLAAALNFTLRPQLVSLFLLALTLYLLFRYPGRHEPKKFLIAIGVTFWVWANADQWFFLGPLALALLCLGGVIQKYGFNTPDDADDAGEPLGRLPDLPTLAKALGLGVLVCTLTPHHVRVWELPFELVGAAGAETDPQLRRFSYAPHESLFINNASLGGNANGLAYLVLFVAGAVVVGFGPARIRSGHVLLWVGFAVLSLLSVYAIPFFVAVAVPLVAAQLNAFSRKAELRTWGDPRTRLLLIGSSGGRVLTAALGVALCVLAYPGWVHPETPDPATVRRAGWGVAPDPALVRAAEQFAAWRASGALAADARGVVPHLDLANYLAFFAPQEKVLFNGRPNHHRPELGDYLAVRRGLGLIPPTADAPTDPAEAAAALDRRGAAFVATHWTPGDGARTQLATQFANRNLYLNWGTWDVWYVDGRTTVFGRGPTRAESRLDPVKLAFGPGVRAAADPEPVQPLLRPETEMDQWVRAFARGAKPAPPGAAETLGLLEYKQALLAREQFRSQLTQAAFFNLPAAPGTGHRLTQLAAGESRLLRFPPRHADSEADADAMLALPVLAVRAARRAIAADPDHPDGYFALARALADPDLPLGPGERALGQVVAYRQCLDRLPRPNLYKRGQYATLGTDAAYGLAQVYLGQRLAGKDKNNQDVLLYSGFPANVAPLTVAFPVSPQAAVVLTRPWRDGTPCVLPLDAAYEALKLATEYARRDLTADAGEGGQALVKQLDDQRTEVGNLLSRAQRRDETGRGPNSRPADALRSAVQNGLLQQALATLGDLPADDYKKEFGALTASAFALRATLELVAGRVENAGTQLAEFGTPEGRPDESPEVTVVRELKYQTAVLTGQYRAAAGLLGGTEKRLGVGRFDKLPPPGPQVPMELVLGAVQVGFGNTRDPRLGLVAMLAPPPLPGPDHGWAVEAGFWGLSWVSTEQNARQLVHDQLVAESALFYRLGVLSLLEGDIDGARERFAATRRRPPPEWALRERALDDFRTVAPGWVLGVAAGAFRDVQIAEARVYLRLIRQARGE